MSQLQKARLFSIDSSQFDFEFLFNPTSLQFKEGVKVKDAEGARTAQGQPKVSFEYPKARTLSLKKLMFDTYEDGANVMDKYVNKLRKAVEFAGFSAGSGTTSTATSTATSTTSGASAAALPRPPIYMFVWGSQNYLRCFVETLDYTLTLFLPDGTPVRAEVNLSLKEVDDSFSNPKMRSYDPQQFGDRDKRAQPPQPITLKSNGKEEADRLTKEAEDLKNKAQQKRDEAAQHRRSEKNKAPNQAAADQAEREAADLQRQADARAEEASRSRALYDRFGDNKDKKDNTDKK
jgi:hypothetical protein